MKKGGEVIYEKGRGDVIIKGGKGVDEDKCYELQYDGEEFYELSSEMLEESYNDGGGWRFGGGRRGYVGKGKCGKEGMIGGKGFVG